jgi:hypothetical protein
MTEEELLCHHQNKLPQTAKRQLKSFPAINSNSNGVHSIGI